MVALAVIDIQNDFMPGGSLAVENSDEIIPRVNQIIQNYNLVIATQDWHPKNHISFATNHQNGKAFQQIKIKGKAETLWPEHCIQGSSGAAFHNDLKTDSFEAVFRKGTDPKIDSYSGFYDNHHLKSTGLAGYFREKGVKEIHFCGLAADYCVYYSIVDALSEGFSVVLHKNATKAINYNRFEKQLQELKMKDNFHLN